MNNHHYENHFDISADKLCPFKVKLVENYYDYSCNWHQNIEIIMVVKGNGFIRYGNEELFFTEGDIVVINSGCLHRLYSKNPLDYYYLIVDERFCNENGISTFDRSFTPIFKSDESVKIFKEVVSALEEYEKSKIDSKFNAPKARLAVLSLLLNLCEKHSVPGVFREKSEKASDEHVKKAVAYIGNHLSDNLSLEGLAEICGITKHHLAREFKRYTGETIVTYVNTQRCKSAMVYMDEGMNVTEAAYRCGFESLSYFSRTYKKIMGTAPSGKKKN